jgi:hypothetical protein
MNEYEKAISLEPMYFEALNGFAYAFWEWRLAFLEGNAAHDPTENLADDAERLARSEVRIARDLKRNDWLNTAEDTLAEVLMADGRFLEAIQQVKEALNQLDEHTESGTNEIHWDAAQANLCAAVNETDPSVRQEEYDEAFKQIRIIKIAEDGGEPRQFTASPEVLDPLRRRVVCATPPEKVALAAELYHARQPKPIGGPCGWFGVIGEVHGQSPNQPLQLHVWGGGVNETLDLSATSEASVVLSTPGQEPSTLHSYYFARLESGGVPVSRTISFSCVKNPSNGPCTKNGVNLIFDRVPLGSDSSGKRQSQVAHVKRPVP